MKEIRSLTVRWTIGNVRPRGFEMLRLSIACAFRLFGSDTRYVVCANSIPVEDARARTGEIPAEVEWRAVTRGDIPAGLSRYLGEDLIGGMGWKLIPLRIEAARPELALDNDCIVWQLPGGMRQWLEGGAGALLAQDVRRCLGSFDAVCRPGAFNAGIRGLSAGQDLGELLIAAAEDARQAADGVLDLTGEIEEQGWQAAAVSRLEPLFLVGTDEVSLCSPFWPLSPEPGTCGAHFVGMNAWHLPWNYYDRPADEWLTEHWQRHRPLLYERAGLL